jgi:hypothetical protein
MTQAKFTVQKGIPLPAPRHAKVKKATRASKYPFRSMKVGDSFEFKGPKAEQFQKSVSVLTKPLANRKFATRKTAEDTVRVWRVL